MLKSGTGIPQAECHSQVTESSEGCDEGGLQAVSWVQFYLVVPRVCIQKTQQLTSGCGVYHLINPWPGKWIFGPGFVEASVVYTHTPFVVLLQHQDWVGKPLWEKYFHNKAGGEEPGYLFSYDSSLLF